MVNSWFTSDFHLGHRNIIRYCSRPFASVEEMDAAILANLNELVGANDVLYFLGDFCLGGPDQARQYRDRIVCRKHTCGRRKSRYGPEQSHRRFLQLEST